MDPSSNDAVGTFVTITGESQAVATRILQENGGDLNAAIDAYFNTREASTPSPPLQNVDRVDYMEEDNAVPGLSQYPVRPLGPFEIPVQHVSSLNRETRLHDADLNQLRGRSRSQPSGMSITPQVSHPREVRDVPIEWPDRDQGADASSRLRPFRQGVFQIEEVSGDDDAHQQSGAQGVVTMDDDAPSSASPVSKLHGQHSENHPFGRSIYPGQREASLFAPQVSEMPPLVYQDVNDVEEEMIRAAIEVSKKEAEEAITWGQQQFESGSRHVADLDTGVENDYLAQAVSLSLQTAEREMALRGQQSIGASLHEESEGGYPIEDSERLGERKGTTSMSENKIAAKPSKESGSFSGSHEEVEEAGVQPLLTRRTRKTSSSGVPQPGNSHIYVNDNPPIVETEQGSSVQHGPEGPSREQVEILPQHSDGLFKPDEWGGISSEEHDEAVMLEAALFGGLPDSALLGIPYHQDRIHGEDFDYTEASNAQWQHPQPLSPSVVAQRLLREQQDDEYLASLAMDREKETKAMQEAEARRVEEQMAASAASAKEKRRLEEESIRLHAIEELARELDIKKANLPPEPAADDENSLTLLVRLPDGSRRGRRFQKSDKLQSLFDFIDVCGGVDPGTYKLVRQYPRRSFQEDELSCSFSSVGLTSKQEVLFLEII